ncbi:hypothetical protein [Nostoc sp. DSM 114159]|jgi:hypothetical protein
MSRITRCKPLWRWKFALGSWLVMGSAIGEAVLPSKNFIPKGLRVGDGKSLLLVGDNISMNGGGLFAFGGRVELGGLAKTWQEKNLDYGKSNVL